MGTKLIPRFSTQQNFSKDSYRNIIRPDALLLKQFPNHTKFNNSKFWSVATDESKNTIVNGYKMKWHNVGNGKVQLRLPIGSFSEWYLCEAYPKGNAKAEQRKIARFKTHLQLIRQNRHTECGALS